MRRLLASWMAGLLLVAIAAAPAGAATGGGDGEIKFVTPPTPAAGKPTAGTQTIQAEVEMSGGLLSSPDYESFTVTVKPRSGDGKSASIANTTGNNQSFKGSWNTKGQSPYNGGYDIEATAVVDTGLLSGPKTFRASVANVLLNNPPAAPTGVSVSLQGETPMVTWKANSEPDLTGYRVLRAVASGSFEQVGSVKTNKFTDSEAPAGLALRYQVVAVRSSPVSDSGITAKSSASKPVTIPAPAAAEGQGDGEAEGAPAGEVPEGVFVPETTTAEPEPEPEPAPPPAQNSGPLAPIIRDEPLARTNVDFDDQLPFDAELPERFSTSSDSPSINAAQSAATDSGDATLANPVKFIATGLFLLVFSIILARTSRRLFKGKPGADGSKPPKVSYPAFRISRSP
ncbi:MAG: hypothetical protein WD602_04785 [Actinomycetota bacterium]